MMLIMRLAVGCTFLQLLAGCAIWRDVAQKEQLESKGAEDSQPAIARRSALTAAVNRDKEQFGGKHLLFGNLHAHSSLSDDVHHRDVDMRPESAFAYARDNGLDFLALSDHHKAANSNNRLFLTEDEFQNGLAAVADTFNARHDDFVAIPALEWGNTSTGNHVNIVAPAQLPPDSILNDEYDELLEWAADNAGFVQFNHPHSWTRDSDRNRDVGNFGEELYASTVDFVDATDGAVATVSIITTVFKGHISGPLKFSEDKTHRQMEWENYYKKYLNMGFRISPSASQDTHWRNWGTVTAARTAIWADDISLGSLIAAFQANRVYASQDDELAVVFQAVKDGRVHWLGDTVALGADEEEIFLRARIWQGRGADGDDQDEGPYTIEVISDWDGKGGREAAVWTTIEDVPSGELVEIPLTVVDGEYIYLHVTEQNGKDNPIGDGEDIFRNGTNRREADGLRDDMNDSAWTSPIWFARPSANLTATAAGSRNRYAWGAGAHLFHDADCWAAALIGEARRKSANAPPQGFEKHQCRKRDAAFDRAEDEMP